MNIKNIMKGLSEYYDIFDVTRHCEIEDLLEKPLVPMVIWFLL